MAVFTSVYIKHGNVWPKDYLAIATLPDGTTKKFRLKRREDANLLFVSAEETDDKTYSAKLQVEPYTFRMKKWIDGSCKTREYKTVNEFCTIDYNGVPLQLNADRCELACADLSYSERREIVRKLQE